MSKFMLFFRRNPEPLFQLTPRGELWLSGAFSILLALLFISYCWGIRFTQYDDVVYVDAMTNHSGVWDASFSTAVGQGRIQFLLGIAITNFFTGLSDTPLFDFSHYGMVFLTFMLFFVAVF